MATKAKAKLPAVPAPRNRPWLVPAAVVALLVWYFASAVSAVSDKSTTFDEVFHLTGGYCSWKFGDFRMQPENGNLPQRWAAIPLLLGNTHFPHLDQKFWYKSDMHEIGEQFLYAVGNDADGMMLRGRAMIALLGVALGALLFFWTRSLLGVGPALVSLGLFAFCPTELANGALVTSDMAAALFFAASMLCIWRVLHRVDWQTLLVGSLVMGGLFVSKFSAFLLVPMGLLLLVFQLISRQPTVISFGSKTWQVHRRPGRLGVHLATIAVHAFVVWVVIWTCYNFRFDMFGTKTLAANQAGEMTVVDRPFVPWDTLFEKPGIVERSIVAMRDAHLLPEAYLYGFANTWHFTKQRVAFLNGKYSETGWRTFFPYCLLVKTPLPLFVLMGLAAPAIVRGWLRSADDWPGRDKAMFGAIYRTAPVWTLFIVYWAVAITSHLNIGHRHILPTYLPMLMLAGGSWLWTERRVRVVSGERPSKDDRDRAEGTKTRWLTERRWPVATCIVLASIGLFAAESLWRWPNYLAYFNQLAGGPSSAYRHLVDSSLDWGQDLPALQHWLVKDNLDGTSAKKTYLAYFGSGNPEYYGIHATLLPGFEDRVPSRIPEPLAAGTYCISATLLENIYSSFSGLWNKLYEPAYQSDAEEVRMFVGSSPEGRDQLVAKMGNAHWFGLFRRYEQLRLARLTSFLRQREPDLEINYSILVYRLGASDLARAIDGPPIELNDTPVGNIKPGEGPIQPE
jgi:hypothetical protein